MDNKAVFLDRDNTLIVDVPYLKDPTQVRLFPETQQELKRLKDNGYYLIVISNQSGVARGLCTSDQVEAVNREMERQLEPVVLDAIYISPDGPDNENSLTRKPAPGMIFQARDHFHLNLKQCFMIGDKIIDVECGKNAQCKTVHLRRDGLRENICGADFVAGDLTETINWILKQENAEK
ncbi:MAG: HAD family hydrolase [Verrucomicrobiae bacterium]|nr:HAD family hydrolase [Verrucomicrobiae bacterium]